MTKEEGLQIITGLVDRFTDQYDSYLKAGYNETFTRRDFIDPFFKALGWDMDNSNGYAEAYREVIHEDRIKVGGAIKAPDYSFRLVGGKRLFFVEAKKPSVAVKNDILPAYQIRRYGWSAKLAVSIITDFEEFAIYDCTKRPNNGDKASVARIKYLSFKDYIKEFDFLWETFSKERVLKGSFDKFISSDKNKKGTATVDNAFLDSLNEWRTLIAIDICKNNPSISEDELNFSVQQIIDRLIFLRIAEDRGIEPYSRLQSTITNGDYYENLNHYFLEADHKYNSGLFDFKKDRITGSLTISNKTLKTIIGELYYPLSPYAFSVLSVEILGNAYEQFLGKQITINAGHKVKIEDKPDVRKAGGVFYTPQFIVEYIVQKTLGSLLRGKKPKEVENIKIIDPSCGSGSFLIGVYDYLLKWHKDYYTKNGKSFTGKRASVLTPDGNLTTNEKKRILTNNIFGVDLDANAVEVTKLSLLLKCMDGETASSLATQFSLFNDRILPTLNNNVKSGNSLIDVDFYDAELDFHIENKIKPFNWKQEFSTVFAKGGFDIVIGNPPYGAGLTKEVQKYCLTKFSIATTDTASLFMIQAQRILKEGGYNGFIIPKAFTYASNWEKTRGELLKDITIIIDCSKVWREVKLEMTIYISCKNRYTKSFISGVRNGVEIFETGVIKKTLCEDFKFIINGVSDDEIALALKMFKSSLRLNDLVSNRRGGMLQQYERTKGDFFLIGGKQVQRYFVNLNEDRRINSEEIESNAVVYEDSLLVQNIVAHIQNPFPRIQISATTVDNDLAIQSAILDTVNQLKNKSSLSHKCILGVLNSSLINWYTYKFVFANAIRTMHFDSTTTAKIPFPEIDLKNKKQKSFHDGIVKSVEHISQLLEERKSVKLTNVMSAIDNKVEYYENKINLDVAALFDISESHLLIIKPLQYA